MKPGASSGGSHEEQSTKSVAHHPCLHCDSWPTSCVSHLPKYWLLFYCRLTLICLSEPKQFLLMNNGDTI